MTQSAVPQTSSRADGLTATPEGYSLDNARRFGWGSVGELNPTRTQLLDEHVVGRSVLDAGCGGGGYVDYLARRGYDAVGLDRHDSFLQLAAERRLAGRFVLGDLTEPLPFPDASFDTVYCIDVLEHINDVAALRELVRVARRRVLLAIPHDGSQLEQYGLMLPTYRDPTHLRYYTEDSVGRLVAAAAPHAAGVQVFREQSLDLRSVIRAYMRPKSGSKLFTVAYYRLLNVLMKYTADAILTTSLGVVIDLPPVAPDTSGRERTGVV